jgi:hypothetical protein
VWQADHNDIDNDVDNDIDSDNKGIDKDVDINNVYRNLGTKIIGNRVVFAL